MQKTKIREKNYFERGLNENEKNSYPEYEDRIKKDIRNTLKDEGGDGHTYSSDQHRLMVWYTYFFLNRGKPSTHIAMLSQLDDNILKNNTPPVLKRLIQTAEHLIKGDENDNISGELATM